MRFDSLACWRRRRPRRPDANSDRPRPALPTEWPTLRERAGKPRRPESGFDRDGGQVDVVNVIGILGDDFGVGALSRSVLSLPLRPLIEHACHGRRPQVQPGASKRLSDLHFAHRRTEPICSKASGPCSSTRCTHDAIVAGVKRNASAVCWSDQQRAALNSMGS